MRKVLLLMLGLSLLSFSANASELISPFVSDDFIKSAQNIEENDYNRLSDVHQIVMILREYDPSLSMLPPQTKTRLVSRVRSFQNPNGGFGDWANDRSKTESTRLALETLDALGSGPKNRTAALSFLSSLQVSGLPYGNYGFRSHLQDPDADLSSTYDAIVSYYLLGTEVPNRVQVVEYVRQHQNNDGGFGLGTNRKAGVFWPSEISQTYRGASALQILGAQPDFREEAIDYVRGLQTGEGGFANTVSASEKASTAATYNAIFALDALGSSANDPSGARVFLENNAEQNGGFLENSVDAEESLHSTYWAVLTIKKLGGNIGKFSSVNYALGYDTSRNDGGFGDIPGGKSVLRTTFDAVYTLNMLGKEPRNKTAAINYVRSLRKQGGGYAEDAGLPNVESTYRAVYALILMGAEPEDKNGTITFLHSSQDESGGFGWSSTSIPRGSYTFRAVKALHLLGSEPKGRQKTIDFMQSLQNPDAGFGNYPGDVSDVTSTYRALSTLEMLGAKAENPDGAAGFVMRSRNADGGFRRSPADIYAPENFSKSVYTYGAVRSLQILNESVPDSVSSFVDSLRNPDLGFGEQPFYTSTVSDSFVSLFTYMSIYPGVLNHAPGISGSVSPSSGDSSTSFELTANYTDEENQFPDEVAASIDGERVLLWPADSDSNLSDGKIYRARMNLPVGEHKVYFSASDPFISSTTSQITVPVSAVSGAPEVSVSVNPAEGDEGTVFVFSATYKDAEGNAPGYVMIAFDEGEWTAMSPADASADYKGGKRYSYNATFGAGIHRFRVKASDGANLMQGGWKEFTVLSDNPAKPESAVLERLKALMLKEGVRIDEGDVAPSVFEGRFAWKITTEKGAYYASRDGSALLRSGSPFDIRLLLVAGALIVLGALGYLWYTGRGNAKRR